LKTSSASSLLSTIQKFIESGAFVDDSARIVRTDTRAGRIVRTDTRAGRIVRTDTRAGRTARIDRAGRTAVLRNCSVKDQRRYVEDRNRENIYGVCTGSLVRGRSGSVPTRLG
jgi:sugar lactone lactonase YvrE